MFIVWVMNKPVPSWNNFFIFHSILWLLDICDMFFYPRTIFRLLLTTASINTMRHPATTSLVLFTYIFWHSWYELINNFICLCVFSWNICILHQHLRFGVLSEDTLNVWPINAWDISITTENGKVWLSNLYLLTLQMLEQNWPTMSHWMNPPPTLTTHGESWENHCAHCVWYSYCKVIM